MVVSSHFLFAPSFTFITTSRLPLLDEKSPMFNNEYVKIKLRNRLYQRILVCFYLTCIFIYFWIHDVGTELLDKFSSYVGYISTLQELFTNKKVNKNYKVTKALKACKSVCLDTR